MRRVTGLLAVLLIGLGVGPARAEGGDRMASFLMVFQGGPVLENSYGGAGVSISLSAGNGRSFFTAGLRLNAGTRWEDDDPKWEPGVEIGFRWLGRMPSGFMPHFAITVGYNHLWQLDRQHDDITYDWHVPLVRIGGGLLWAVNRRFSVGFDVSYLGGFAIHANAGENPWGETYDWQYNAGTVQAMMTF